MKYVKTMWWYKEILLKYFIRLGKMGDTPCSHTKNPQYGKILFSV